MQWVRAPADRYIQAPQGYRPTDYLPGAGSVITFAYKLNKGPVHNLPRTRNQYMVEFEAVNQILLQMAHKIARFLEAKDVIGKVKEMKDIILI
ncbi:MAG: hypothetical protein ACOY4I_04535 [Bacillota bacterium]